MKGQESRRFIRGLARETGKKTGRIRKRSFGLYPRGAAIRTPGAAGWSLLQSRAVKGGSGEPKIILLVSNCKDPMPKASLSPAAPAVPPSYEAAQEELEQLVSRLESGQLPLDQLLTAYQRGAELLKFCRDKLEAVENQISVLDQGVLKPWARE